MNYIFFDYKTLKFIVNKNKLMIELYINPNELAVILYCSQNAAPSNSRKTYREYKFEI
jgi:hypothetical protein